ncbi:transcriptional Coactivator p15-domain-containing protein [Naematelia encephala]|uniref:Transcriptional Coactivator p15-domain-containing protein n=1 Tax=Naematelia encephala TaxID=71784 RepID=A0A1Y2BCK4_9TREE|nr:transcriptional Coactivator p15-domain-containing protein [Naematelia encephala]
MGRVKRDPEDSPDIIDSSDEEVIKPSKKRKSVGDSKDKKASKKEAKGGESSSSADTELGKVKVNDEGESYFELSEWRRVTVRKFGGKALVDIRQVYKDKATGQMKPAAKGLALTLEQWQMLKSNIDTVDELIRGLED